MYYPNNFKKIIWGRYPSFLHEANKKLIHIERWCQSKSNTQLWMWLVLEVKSDAVKSNISQKHGMLGPWIKANWKCWPTQEMVRVNTDILGISELKWTGMGEFNSDDHYIYYCEQESLRRNGAAIIVNKRV